MKPAYYHGLALALLICGCHKPPAAPAPSPQSRVIVQPAVSPSGRQVAFLVSTKIAHGMRDWRLWTLSLAGGKATDTHVEALSAPAWSPDESRIVFIGRDGGLAEFNLATHASRALANPTCKKPEYSPDGKLLAFFRLVEGGKSPRYNIVIENPTTHESAVIDNAGWSYCWAKDSKGLFYVHGNAIYRYDLATKKTELVLKPDPNGPIRNTISNLILSPDGNKLGFSRSLKIAVAPAPAPKPTDQPPSKRSFYVVDLRIKDPQHVFDFDHYFQDVRWNKAGMLYLDRDGAERRERGRLMIYDLDKGTSKALYTGPIAQFDWIDESHILFRQSNEELCVLDVATGIQKHIFALSDAAAQN